jgi:hypothetical protein
MLDQHLNWKIHHAYTIEKGTKWAAQVRRKGFVEERGENK